MLKTPFLKLSFSLFILLGLFLTTLPKEFFPDWLVLPLSGIGAFLFAFLMLLPRIFYKTTMNTPLEKDQAITKLQTYAAIGFLMSYGGTLGLFRLYLVGFPYDKLIHFIFPLLASIAIIEFLYYWYNRGVFYAAFYGLAAVLLIAIGWELAEYFSDLYLGTKSFGQLGTDFFRDTLWDGILNVVGMTSGFYLAKKNIRNNP
ncbi:MAG: hypothetical protein Q8P45_02370 [Candidatus Harrisonbacteria bacterium]|nr:hypothetical protein [Candidatus Harrisonbacteria bacterium]